MDSSNLVNQLEAERVQGKSKEERKAEKQAKRDAKKAANTGGGMMTDPFIGTQETPAEEMQNPASLQRGLVAPGSAPMQFVQSPACGCVSRATGHVRAIS